MSKTEPFNQEKLAVIRSYLAGQFPPPVYEISETTQSDAHVFRIYKSGDLKHEVIAPRALLTDRTPTAQQLNESIRSQNLANKIREQGSTPVFVEWKKPAR